MPPFHVVVVAILTLLPPTYSIALIVFNTHYSPYCRTISALGRGIILNSAIITLFAIIGATFESQTMAWLPLLLIGMGTFAVMRIMHIEVC